MELNLSHVAMAPHEMGQNMSFAGSVYTHPTDTDDTMTLVGFNIT